jgi:hypothetical protein
MKTAPAIPSRICFLEKLNPRITGTISQVTTGVNIPSLEKLTSPNPKENSPATHTIQFVLLRPLVR